MACSTFLLTGLLSFAACGTNDHAVLERILLQPADLGTDWTASDPHKIDPDEDGTLLSVCSVKAAKSRNLVHRADSAKGLLVQQTSVILSETSAATCFNEVKREIFEIAGAQQVSSTPSDNPILSWTVPFASSTERAYLTLIQHDRLAIVLNFGSVDEQSPEVTRVIQAADKKLSEAVAAEE